jgi:hypothetical protein
MATAQKTTACHDRGSSRRFTPRTPESVGLDAIPRTLRDWFGAIDRIAGWLACGTLTNQQSPVRRYRLVPVFAASPRATLNSCLARRRFRRI